MDIQPIEEFVFKGLVQRASQVFGCRAILVTANDKQAALAKTFNGQPVEYPYLFITPGSLSNNTESYATNFLARKGLMTTVGEKQGMVVKLMPANFETEFEFCTNKFMAVEQGSVLSYAKRWLFARRAGWLKFNVEYGRLRLPISLTLADSVPTPPMENKTENESVYKIVSTCTVHGWISEATLQTQGVVNTIELQTTIAGVGAQFFPFN